MVEKKGGEEREGEIPKERGGEKRENVSESRLLFAALHAILHSFISNGFEVGRRNQEEKRGKGEEGGGRVRHAQEIGS